MQETEYRKFWQSWEKHDLNNLLKRRDTGMVNAHSFPRKKTLLLCVKNSSGSVGTRVW